jgi:hypothetical protein
MVHSGTGPGAAGDHGGEGEASAEALLAAPASGFAEADPGEDARVGEDVVAAAAATTHRRSEE